MELSQQGKGSFTWPDALRQMARRYENLVQALSILRKMDELDSPETDIHVIFRRILEVVATGLFAENCSLMLLDENSGELLLRAACSPLEEGGRAFNGAEWAGWRFHIGEGIVGLAAQTGEPVRIDDVQQDDQFVQLLQSPVRIRSILCYPLITDGRTIGVLNLSHSKPGFFTVESENILALITQRAARIFSAHTLRQQIREKEEHYRLVTENAGDGIIVFDQNGRVLSVNPAVESITGGSDTTASISTWQEFIHEDDRQRFQLHWLRVTETGAADRIEYRFRDGSGNYHDLEQHSSPMQHPGSNVRGAVAVIRDVTERKRAEEEVLRYREKLEEMVEERSAELRVTNENLSREIAERRQAETTMRRLATIIEQGTEAVTVTDKEGVIEYVNPAFESVTGYSRDEVIGENCRILKSGRQDEAFYRQLWHTISKGQVWHGHITNRHRNGSLFEESAIISPVRDLAGTIVNYVKMARDVTRERELEEHLRQSQKLEAIGALAGGIAHDFNNILYAVLGYTRLALDDLPDDSSTYALLREVVKAGKRARDLVEQILTFGRRGEHVRESVLWQPVVREALKLLRSTLPSTIEIDTDIDRDTGPVLADPTQLHQVIMNLCTNAGHAMRDTGGTLHVSLRELKPDPVLIENHPDLHEETYVVLSVNDTGHGMNRETMARIFEPYFSTKEVGEGIGLGLATVHGIVKDMEGCILVTSEPGSGSSFDVYLPQHHEAADEDLDLDRDGEEDLPEGTEHVLFVDDEVMIANVGEIALRRLGYQVTVCTDSRDALRLFKEAPGNFDVVITDQTMPKLTGIDLAREILSISENTPVILCTGYSEIVDRKSAYEAGIREYLKKPCMDQELANAIRQVLS